MTIDVARFRDTFFQEADEHLAQMESSLLHLEQTGERDSESLDAIFRGAHSIKGAAGTFGFDEITAFTHCLETLLDGLRAGEVALTRPCVGVLLSAVDVLSAMLAAARGSGSPPANAAEVTVLLQAAMEAKVLPDDLVAEAAGSPAATATYRIRFIPHGGIFLQGMDPILLLCELRTVGEVLEITADLSRLPHLRAMDPDECYLGWTARLASAAGAERIHDVFAFVEDASEISIEVEGALPAGPPAKTEATAKTPSREASSIRVSTAKVDKLIDLVGELVIAESMASEILKDFSLHRLSALVSAFAEMGRYTRELQERVMGIRMLPIGSVFSRFPRVLRDLAAAQGKQISLELSGEETELDKQMVDSLSDPLTHLVRNAIDHGIEEPAERRKAGKPEQGVIRLHAFHRGGNVLVEVTDDGRGLDLAKIQRKALERGLLSAGDTPSDETLQALIFHPGFSTADHVTNLSGRGVGMDVVKRNVDALNGAVSVSSELGRGSTVCIKLPLTLAILDGLLLKVGAQTFVLPLISILESIRPKAQQLNVVAGSGEVVAVRGEPLPMLRLHQLFGIPTDVTDPTRGLLVVVENQGKRLAFLVDELLGQQQVVVKSLEANFRKVEGVAGATILGDGRAALILDVAGLAQLARVSTRIGV